MGYYDQIERNVTLSFVMSTEDHPGDINHNSRTKRDGGVRKRGVKERRDWNVFEDVRARNEDEVVSVLDELYGDRLIEYNEKQIQDGRLNRVITMERWYNNQRASRKGNGGIKQGYEEFILAMGDRLTACPFIYKTNKEGRPVDADGNVIEEWQTNKALVPVRDAQGRPIKSARYEAMVTFLRDAYREFKENTPEVIPLGMFVHADENGHIHAHVDYITPVDDSKTIGVRLSNTDCYRKICDRLGLKYKNARKGNAKEAWTEYMRENVLPRLMKRHGFNRIDGGCAGMEHETVEKHKETADRRAKKTDEEIQKKRAELAAVAKYAERKQSAAVEREAQVKKRESAIIARESALKQRETELLSKEKRIVGKETELANRESSLVNRERNAAEMAATAEHAHEKWRKRLSETNALYESWNLRNKEMEEKEKAMEAKEKAFKQREVAASVAIKKIPWVEKNIWIIKKVLETHPDWLKEREQEARIEFEKFRRKAKLRGLEI